MASSLSTNSTTIYRGKFHRIHGTNITLSPDRNTATCTSTDYRQRFVFSSRPLKIGELIHLNVEVDVQDTEVSFGFGLADMDPESMEEAAHFHERYYKKAKSWIQEVPVLNDTIDVAYSIDHNGQVTIRVDQQMDVVNAKMLDVQVPLWAILFVRGESSTVTLVKTATTFEENCHGQRQVPTEETSVSGAAFSLDELRDFLMKLNQGRHAVEDAQNLVTTHIPTVVSIENASCNLPEATDSSHVAAALETSQSRRKSETKILPTARTEDNTAAQQIPTVENAPCNSADRQHAVLGTTPTPTKPVCKRRPSTAGKEATTAPVADEDHFVFQPLNVLSKHRVVVNNQTQWWYFGTQPLDLHQKIYVRIDAKEPGDKDTVIFGLTRLSPDNFHWKNIPNNPKLLDNLDPDWYTIDVLKQRDFKKGDYFMFYLKNDKELSYTCMNNSIDAEYANANWTGPVWPFLKINGVFVRVAMYRRVEVSNEQTSKSEIVDDSNLCSICFEKEIDAVLSGCGHMNMCFGCSKRQKNAKNAGKCPMCRTPIRDIIKVYK